MRFRSRMLAWLALGWKSGLPEIASADALRTAASGSQGTSPHDQVGMLGSGDSVG